MSNSFFIHIDADAFFASVEQCIHRELRGKFVVTGRDGAMAIAMSYKAKALGVERATPMHIINKDFPHVHMVASDYFIYRIFSQRMLNIIQTYIPKIQRKSLDECSADITNSVGSFSQAYDLAFIIKQELELKLQCNFSIGISSSELLAKMASGINKPLELTIIDVSKDLFYLEEPI
jgi:DNA polymerase-4